MSAGTHTVATEPQREREYRNKHNTDLVVWRIGLQDAQSTAPDGLFELHKKAGYDPPKPGDQIEVERHFEGTDNQGNPFTRLYLASQQGPSPGGHRPRGGSGGGGGYSQGDIARITRSHSQEMAIRFIAAAGHAEELELSNVSDVGPYMNAVVARLADWFDADVAKAEARVKGAESPPAPAPAPAQMEVPADREGLNGGDKPAAAVSSDDSIPF